MADDRKRVPVAAAPDITAPTKLGVKHAPAGMGTDDGARRASPRLDMPRSESPGLDMPGSESPGQYMPGSESLRVDMPRSESPRLDMPRPGGGHLLADESDIPGEDSATVKVPRVEGEPATPPPLPPSPAYAAVQKWLVEDGPTRPVGLTELDGPSLDERLPSSPAIETARHLLPPPTELAPASKRLLALTAVTSLAVGVVIGALLFRGRGTGPAAPAPPAAAQAGAPAEVCGPAAPDAGPAR